MRFEPLDDKHDQDLTRQGRPVLKGEQNELDHLLLHSCGEDTRIGARMRGEGRGYEVSGEDTV